MKLHGHSLIADQLSAGTGASTQITSPLNLAKLDGSFYQAGPQDVDHALQFAAHAFETFRLTKPQDRANCLERIGEEILALGDDLIERCHLETGLTKDRLTGERSRTVNQLKMFADLVREGSWIDARIDTAIPDRKPAPKPDIRRMLLPLGPVIVFGSSNFPLAFSVAGGDAASALAAGCPVVVKAHSAHPGTSEMVASAVARAIAARGLDPGIFSMLHGRGSVIGVALVKHPLASAVGFTGSRKAGRGLFDTAAERQSPIPVFAEMSSLNPVFLLPGALRERAPQIAAGLLNSFTLGVGQFCTKPGLVFGLAGGELETFGRELARLVREAAPATMLHADICSSYVKGLATAVHVPGVKSLANSAKVADPNQTHGRPTVLQTDADNFLKHPELAEEVFGPFLLIVSARAVSDLEKVARQLEGQLTATIHGTASDMETAAGLVNVLREKAGRLLLNGFPTGVEVCPSMHHGGPYPATTDSRFTSVGTAAIQRFSRPVCFQGFPAELLPEELRDGNPRGIWRLVNGQLTKE